MSVCPVPFNPEDFNSNEAFHTALDYGGHHTLEERRVAGLALLDWIADGGLEREGWTAEAAEHQAGFITRRLKKDGVL